MDFKNLYIDFDNIEDALKHMSEGYIRVLMPIEYWRYNCKNNDQFNYICSLQNSLILKLLDFKFIALILINHVKEDEEKDQIKIVFNKELTNVKKETEEFAKVAAEIHSN